MFISYAQNGEDVWLQRVFEGKNDGFYIDVGAHHPEIDSVTKSFYDRGWHGINIEPIPDLYQMFVKERSRDMNLQCACGAQNAILDLHLPPAGQQGVATLDAHSAQHISQTVDNSALLPVQVTTLAEICAKHAPDAIDFLKIDVEGFEESVIRGMDFVKFRPVVLIVEATKPMCLMRDPVADASYAAWHSWEPLLMNADYVFATFDGLNRYYVRKEDQHFVAKFIIPISPLVDGYVKHEGTTSVQAATSEFFCGN